MNNSFTQCIADICGNELATLGSGYKYSIFDGNTAVIEGHKGIGFFSNEKISFHVKKGVLTFSGRDLKIKCIDKHFAVIVGCVFKAEVTI